MNYLIQKWSQVQNDHRNAISIDINELTINVLYSWNPDLFTIVQKRLFDFFDRNVTTFHEVPLTPYFSVKQHHKKRWDPLTPYAWCDYWTATISNHWFDCLKCSTTRKCQSLSILVVEKENWHIMNQVLTLYFFMIWLTELNLT